MVTPLTKEFKSFLVGVNKVHSNYQDKVITNPDAEFKKNNLWYVDGKTYIKIVEVGKYDKAKTPKSAWGFINKTNGDVLKAASWSAPAKGARGNIFDKSNGLETITPYGPAYRR